MTHNVNEQLHELYQEKWPNLMDLLVQQPSSTYTNPLVLKIKEEEWGKADLKVMIFGQETLGWGKDKDGKPTFSTSLDDGLQRYEQFYNERCNIKRMKKSVFFTGIARLSHALQRQPFLADKNISYVWNNISKIGKQNATSINPSVRELERQHFKVIADEVKILTPDVVIFLTGPKRDYDLKFHFPKATARPTAAKDRHGKALPTRKMAFLEGYPFKAIRLYHPGFYGAFTNAYVEAAAKEICHLLEA